MRATLEQYCVAGNYMNRPEGTIVLKNIVIMLTLVCIASGCTGKTGEELYAEGVKLLTSGNANGAIVFFRNALEKDQNHLNARYQLARAYLSEKKYEQAEKEFQKVKRMNPTQPGIQLELAALYNGQRKPDLAITQAKEYLVLKPDSAEALESLGISYGMKNMHQEAESSFARALQVNPERLSAKLELAALHTTQGKGEQAKLLLENIISSDPRNSRAYYLLADAEIALGRKEKALDLYKKLGELNGADPVAPYKLGLLHFDMGHFEVAEAISGEIIKKFPSHAEGYRLKGFVSYRNKKYPEAITALQHANKLSPNVAGYYYLGLSLHGNGDLESALSQFRQILDRTPSFHQARLLTGMVLLQQKRVDDAITELKKILDADSRNSLAHSVLGSAYMAKGLYEEGLKELDTATSLEPRLVDAYLKKGMFHLSQGKGAEVEMDLKTAINIAPEIVNTRLILSSFYEHQNDRAKALATLQEGITDKKSDVVIYYAIARILFADGKPAEAMRYLDRAKESNPDVVASHFIIAAYYASVRDTVKALNEYAEILKKEPGNVKAMLQTAALLEYSGRDGEALAWYLKAKESHHPSAYQALARYYEKKSGTEKALAILMEADRYTPRSADIMEQKIQLFVKSGQFKDALKICNDMEPVSPERGISRRAIVYSAMKKMPEAIKEAERAVSLKPDAGSGYLLLASVYREQNSVDRAIETLKKGMVRDGSNPQLPIELATLYSRQGNNALALKISEDLVRKNSSYAPAYFAQGTFLEALGRKKEAVRKYRNALALANDYAAALNNLSFLYADGYGSKEEALRLAERAITLDPGNPGIMDTVGYALLLNGRHREARDYLERALILLPADPTVNYHLALLHKATGEKKLAVERLHAALRTENFTGVQQAKSLLAELN